MYVDIKGHYHPEEYSSGVGDNGLNICVLPLFGGQWGSASGKPPVLARLARPRRDRSAGV